MSIVIRVRNESRQSGQSQNDQSNLWSTENSGVQHNPGKTEEIREKIEQLQTIESDLGDEIAQLEDLLDDASTCLRNIQDFDSLDISIRGSLTKSEEALLELVSDSEDRKIDLERERDSTQREMDDLQDELEDAEGEEQQEQDTLWNTERVSQQSENTLWSIESREVQYGNPVRDNEETSLQCERDVLVGEKARVVNALESIPFSEMSTTRAKELLEANRRLGRRIQEIDNQLGSSNDNMWSV